MIRVQKPAPAPIILADYFVKKLSFEQNDAFVPTNSDQVIDTDLDLSYNTVPLDENQLRWTIDMLVASTAADAIKLPYQFQIEMSATVVIVPEYPNKQQLVDVTGTSMVYGICREKVRLACSHGKYRPMLLPTISFMPQQTKPTDLPAQASKA